MTIVNVVVNISDGVMSERRLTYLHPFLTTLFLDDEDMQSPKCRTLARDLCGWTPE